MSSLLFALCMDYLDRILSYVEELEGFKYHSQCRRLQLKHLYFADDLLMFCHGDFKSIYMLLQGFQLFSHTSGLEVNQQKSEVYFTGMNQRDTQRVTEASGFKVGKLPFKYLGVPISTSKLKARDCQALIEKMVNRIRIWSIRHLSFAIVVN